MVTILVPFKCCAANPPFFRPARIFIIFIGFLVNALKAIAIRRI